MTDRPVILLDVDGVLNVLADRPGLALYRATAHDGSHWTLRIDPETPALVGRLAELGELVWCSTWLNATDAIAPLVDQPTGLPHVELPESGPGPSGQPGISRKAPYVRDWLDRHLAGRAAVWLDDDHGPNDEELLQEVGTVRCRAVDPTRGLRSADVDVVEMWLTTRARLRYLADTHHIHTFEDLKQASAGRMVQPLLEAGWEPEDILAWLAAPNAALRGKEPAALLDTASEELGRLTEEEAKGVC